jgi:single-strand DNA-binding protein
MANFNKVILAGNMTRDPELSYTPSNTAVCKFGIAVNRKWFSKADNAQREETMFIDCVAWSKSAEIINQYMRKGRPILIEGRLVLDTWTSNEGQKRSRHTVTVDTFQFLGGAPSQGGASQSGGDREASNVAHHAPQESAPPPAPPAPAETDDVPF